MNFPKSYTGLSLQPSSKHVIELLKRIEKNNGVLVHSSGHGKEEGTELKGTLTYRTGLNSGIMIAEGTPEEVLANDLVRQVYLGQSFSL